MNCPVCGKEMERGGLALDGPYRTRWHVTKRLAYVCRDCRKIILDY